MYKETAIEVKSVFKKYKLYDNPMDRLKESINPLGKKYHKEFYALKDISFEVKRGETIGIIGKNGSGKSTLLKLITGVLTSTSGEITTSGTISSLLELGAGFNPEYTGMENIYLNGTIMGLSKQCIDEKLEEIIVFAEIGEFINQPLKTYSSGMFARLAFAVAVNVDPDILIVDEALSVGDAFFQNKCFHKFNEFKDKGKTILFVSHDIASVKQLCEKVLWLNEGEMEKFGDKEEVCSEYVNQQINSQNKLSVVKKDNQRNINNECKVLKSSRNKQFPIPRIQNSVPSGGTGDAEIISLFISDCYGDLVSILQVEEEYNFHIVATLKKELHDVLFGFYIENNKGIRVIGINNAISKKTLEYMEPNKIYEVIFKIKLPKIQKGEYLVSPAIASGTQENHLVHSWYHNLVLVNIENQGYNLSTIELESEIDIVEHSEDNIILYNQK